MLLNIIQPFIQKLTHCHNTLTRTKQHVVRIKTDCQILSILCGKQELTCSLPSHTLTPQHVMHPCICFPAHLPFSVTFFVSSLSPHDSFFTYSLKFTLGQKAERLAMEKPTISSDDKRCKS